MNVVTLATIAFLTLLIALLIAVRLFYMYVKETLRFIKEQREWLEEEKREFQKVKEDD